MTYMFDQSTLRMSLIIDIGNVQGTDHSTNCRWMMDDDLDYFDDMDSKGILIERSREQITNCGPLENLASHTFQSSIEQSVQICHV